MWVSEVFLATNHLSNFFHPSFNLFFFCEEILKPTAESKTVFFFTLLTCWQRADQLTLSSYINYPPLYLQCWNKNKDFFCPKPDFAQYSDPVSLCPGRSVRITVPLSLCVWVQTSVCLSPAPSVWTPSSPSCPTPSSNVRPAMRAGSTETVCRYALCVPLTLLTFSHTDGSTSDCRLTASCLNEK